MTEVQERTVASPPPVVAAAQVPRDYSAITQLNRAHIEEYNSAF